jgi:hypothetical protein
MDKYGVSRKIDCLAVFKTSYPDIHSSALEGTGLGVTKYLLEAPEVLFESNQELYGWILQRQGFACS